MTTTTTTTAWIVSAPKKAAGAVLVGQRGPADLQLDAGEVGGADDRLETLGRRGAAERDRVEHVVALALDCREAREVDPVPDRHDLVGAHRERAAA